MHFMPSTTLLSTVDNIIDTDVPIHHDAYGSTTNTNFFPLYSATVHASRVRRELERLRNPLLTLIPKFTHYITTSSLPTSQLSLSPGSPLLSSLHWSSLPWKSKSPRISTIPKPHTKLDNIPFFRKAFPIIQLSRSGFEGPLQVARSRFTGSITRGKQGCDVEQFRLDTQLTRGGFTLSDYC